MALPRDEHGRQITANGVAFRFDNNTVISREGSDLPAIGVKGGAVTLVDFEGYYMVPKERTRRVNGMVVLLDEDPDA